GAGLAVPSRRPAVLRVVLDPLRLSEERHLPRRPATARQWLLSKHGVGRLLRRLRPHPHGELPAERGRGAERRRRSEGPREGDSRRAAAFNPARLPACGATPARRRRGQAVSGWWASL